MKLSPAQQEQLVALLARSYFDIVEIETQFGLAVGGGDYRPRIDYFHDAVRALTNELPVGYDGSSRLNVEWLAYDVASLRYIQSMPLSPFEPHHYSAETQLITKASGAVSKTPKRPDRKIKQRLAELYQYYGILFSALLKPCADDDFRERTDSTHQDIQNINALIDQLAAGTTATAISNIANHLEDDELRANLQAFLQSERHKQKPEIKKLLASLKGEIKKKNKMIDGVEQAYMDYGLAQLGLYESGKDSLKKMATSGMNLVGGFVEAALAETRREIGR